jgi:hypothetical protein
MSEPHTQAHGGELVIECRPLPDAAPPLQWLEEMLTDSSRPLRFEGRTADDRLVRVEGPLFPAPSEWGSEGACNAYRLSGRARVEVGTSVDASEAEWRFGIANLLFEAPEITDLPDGGGDRRIMHLQLGPHAVRLERSGDYKQAKSYLRGRHRIRVTAEACVSAAVDFGQAQELTQDLCALLSIAQGSLTNWIYCDQAGPDGARLYS